jgi:transcription antitermination factor NusG
LWHVLYVIVKNEKKIASQLSEKCVNHYLPLRQEVRRWSDRRVTISTPLFPGYLFVRCSVAQRTSILQIPGVVRFVKRGLTPAIIPDAEFARLVQLLECNSAEPRDYLEPGKRVRLTGGVFEGFEGTYVREKGRLRAIVAIEWLQRSVIIDVEACDLQPSARYVYVASA